LENNETERHSDAFRHILMERNDNTDAFHEPKRRSSPFRALHPAETGCFNPLNVISFLSLDQFHNALENLPLCQWRRWEHFWFQAALYKYLIPIMIFAGRKPER